MYLSGIVHQAFSPSLCRQDDLFYYIIHMVDQVQQQYKSSRMIYPAGISSIANSLFRFSPLLLLLLLLLLLCCCCYAAAVL